MPKWSKWSDFPKPEKPQKTGKFTWLAMWLIVVTNFFRLLNVFLPEKVKNELIFALWIFIQELSRKNYQIFD